MSGDKAMKKKLVEEFQIKGYWKIPCKPEKVAGTLFYTQDEIRLELLGSFGGDLIFDFSLSKYDTLFGFSDHGEQFSLYDVQLKHSPSNFPGFMTQTYSVKEFIVGGHFEQKSDITFHSMMLYPTYLAEWIGRLHYTTIYKEENQRTYINAVEWNKAPHISTYIAAKEFQLEEIHANDVTYKTQGLEWANRTALKIIPNEPKGLNWYNETRNTLHLFLTTMINKPVSEMSVVFTGDVDERLAEEGLTIRKTYKYFYRSDAAKVEETFRADQALIKFSDIETNIGEMISKWFEFRDNHKIVSELYSEQFYKPSYVNSSFLNALQTLELYHNKITGYRTTKLEKRLKDLFDSLHFDSAQFLIGSDAEKELLIAALVDTRNYLTHFDLGEKQHILEDDEKFTVGMLLKAIIGFIILRDLGISEDILVKRFAEEWDIAYNIHKGKMYFHVQANELVLK